MPASSFELNPSAYISSIARHPEFSQRRQASENLPYAIGGTATLLAQLETKESGHRSSEGDVYAVIANINSFAQASAELDDLSEWEHPTDGSSGREISDVERDKQTEYKRDVINFNHAVKELVDHQPSLTFDGVTTFITQMYVAINKPILQTLPRETALAQRDAFYGSVKRRLNGMRSELGAEMILGAIDDIDYAHADDKDAETTIKNELRGIDYFVTVRGYTFGIDIKASRGAVTDARKGGESKNDYRAESIIWSQLTPNDFVNGGFRIARETAEERAPAMRAELMTAYHAEIQRRDQPKSRRRA